MDIEEKKVSSYTCCHNTVPSLIALGTEELQSGGTANERFTFGPYTSCILETVLARNMPSSDVMCTLDFSSLYTTSADSLPSESEVIGAFLCAVYAED